LSAQVAIKAKSMGDIMVKEDGAGTITKMVNRFERSAT